MPRRPREYSSTGIYHVMMRENEHKDIFYDKEDREKFLCILAQKKYNREYELYGYCLMDNHIHLIIKENKDPITRVMKRINTSYANYFNKKYDRVGHVFQDRYKSEVIEEESYLLEVIRYVHNNPVKAKLVDSPGQYPWSSFHLYMNSAGHSTGFVECEQILEIYSQNKRIAVKKWVEYTNRQGTEDFLEVEEEKKESRMQIAIGNFLEEKKITLQQLREERLLRNELIRVLKKDPNNSIRKIAEALGVNRNMVQREGKN